MQIVKDGDALLVPIRVWHDGGLFEGTVRLVPGDDDYEKYLAEYESYGPDGWHISDEANAAVAAIIAKHRRGEL
jgi:hypothetical protein